MTTSAALRHPLGERFSPDEAAGWITGTVRELSDRDAIALLSVPAPVIAPEALLRALPEQPASLWQPPSGPAFAAVGCAERIDVAGANRIDDLRAQAERLWPRVVTRAAGEAPPYSPRLFGGLAFQAGGAVDIPWRDHGDGSFILPRWCYTLAADGSRAWLTVAVTEPHTHDPVALGRRVADMLETLAQDAGPAATRAAATDVHQQPVEPWSERVEAIRDVIASGASEKIVLARRATIDLSAPMDPTGVLSRLAARYRDCFRYGFRRGMSTFVGATPERLISKQGDRIATEALAGSIAIGTDAAPDVLTRRGQELLASAKDRAEHDLVVRAIGQALRPLCNQLELPDTPSICTLRHVLHLRTPVSGTLAGDTHVLELVRALHPTPAVGGVPTASAVDWIARHERDERGWYAGPVGWFDAAGDGEFAVALRAGVLRGRHAYVYAGAGIVADSNADAEYAETGIKQRAILGALGVAG